MFFVHLPQKTPRNQKEEASRKAAKAQRIRKGFFFTVTSRLYVFA
jgi:hypothetical protein